MSQSAHNNPDQYASYLASLSGQVDDEIEESPDDEPDSTAVQYRTVRHVKRVPRTEVDREYWWIYMTYGAFTMTMENGQYLGRAIIDVTNTQYTKFGHARLDPLQAAELAGLTDEQILERYGRKTLTQSYGSSRAIESAREMRIVLSGSVGQTEAGKRSLPISGRKVRTRLTIVTQDPT